MDSCTALARSSSRGPVTGPPRSSSSTVNAAAATTATEAGNPPPPYGQAPRAPSEDFTVDEKIVLNVGGIRHETLLSTLLEKSGTRLSQLAEKHVRGACSEYFFDRHPGVFSTVMDYYRAGQLHVPLDVCGAVVKRELDFWQIEDKQIEPCCWINYSSYIDAQQTLSEFNESVDNERAELETIRSYTGWKRKQAKIWMILDHPRSSNLALGYAVTSFLFVLASILGFCLETLPVPPKGGAGNATNITDPDEEFAIEVIDLDDTPNFLEILDYICTLFFTIELIVRIIFAPNKKAFFRSPMNIIDIMALLPLYVQITLEMTDRQNSLKNHRAVIETIFILRIIRIFRIFHLVKHYKALKILVHAIKASVQELLMLSIFLFIAMLVFSTLIFYAERSVLGDEGGGDFDTIPIGFYWSIITMTTVGYGDLYPNTSLGYMIGAMCALSGVLLVALTIPVISNNFALFYMHARTRETITAKDYTDLQNSIAEEEDPDDRPEEPESPEPMLKEKNSKNSLTKGSHSAFDSRALLMSADSNSLTDESGIMLTSTTRSQDHDTPQKPQQSSNNTHETSM